MSRLRFGVAVLVVVGFLTLSSRASADTLNLAFDNGGNGVNGGGPFNWTQKTPVNTNFASSFQTYCIDIHDYVHSGTFTTNTDLTKAPTIGNDSTKVAAINTLFDHFYSSSLGNATSEATFQLALWELVYGSSVNSQVGATSAQVTAAGKLLDGSAWNGTEHDLASARLVALVDSSGTTPGTSGRNQDQLLVQSVPAPPALMLAGVGVLALLGRARWAKRAA
jgi:hypothetical protein